MLDIFFDEEIKERLLFISLEVINSDLVWVFIDILEQLCIVRKLRKEITLTSLKLMSKSDAAIATTVPLWNNGSSTFCLREAERPFDWVIVLEAPDLDLAIRYVNLILIIKDQFSKI